MAKYTNSLPEVRPTSTFDSYLPQTDTQRQIAAGLQSLAHQVAAKLKKDGGFDHARMVNLYGGPGRGKTHLSEAFVNELRGNLQNAAKTIWVVRGESGEYVLKHHAITENPKVILVDDLFTEYANVVDLQSKIQARPNVLPNLADALKDIYEKKILLLTTSNFPIGEVIDLLTDQIDPIGRVRSRIAEMSLRTVEIDGPDYRTKLKKLREGSDDPFTL